MVPCGGGARRRGERDLVEAGEAVPADPAPTASEADHRQPVETRFVHDQIVPWRGAFAHRHAVQS